ncbi:MAG: DUF11 domain-containing protein [Acidobacteriota bacterium]
MSPDELERHLESCDPDRRDFLKSLILGTAYAAPLVTSFGMGGLGAAPADASVGTSLANLCDPMPANVTANVVINKSSTRAFAGQQMSYFIEVFNCGPNAAIQVEVQDTLPAGITFVSSSQLEGDVTFNITEPAVGSEGGEWRAVAKGLAVGFSARFQIIMQVPL